MKLLLSDFTAATFLPMRVKTCKSEVWRRLLRGVEQGAPGSPFELAIKPT
jgi:hypothetical protein